MQLKPNAQLESLHNWMERAMFVRSLNSKGIRVPKQKMSQFLGKKIMTARKGQRWQSMREHSFHGTVTMNNNLCPVALVTCCMQIAQLRRTFAGVIALTREGDLSWGFLGRRKRLANRAATALAHSQITTCSSRVAVMFVRYRCGSFGIFCGYANPQCRVSSLVPTGCTKCHLQDVEHI